MEEDNSTWTTSMTAMVTSMFGFQHEVSIEYTINRAYSALYMRILLSAIQLLSVVAGIPLAVWLEVNKLSSVANIVMCVMTFLWIILEIVHSGFKIKKPTIEFPFNVWLIVFALASLLPFGNLFQLGAMAGVIIMLLVIPFDSILWDRDLLYLVEQKELELLNSEEKAKE